MKFTYVFACALLSLVLISTAITLRDSNDALTMAAEGEAVKKVISRKQKPFGTRISNDYPTVGCTRIMSGLSGGGNTGG